MKGNNIIFRNSEAIGKNIKWWKGDGDGNFAEENKDLKYRGWEEYQVVGNFVHPCVFIKTINLVLYDLAINALTELENMEWTPIDKYVGQNLKPH